MQLPGYRIERLIAEGGMASVYLAVQESLDRYVALKVLKRFDSPTQTLRFFNEGKFIASLNHRNIITIHDIGVVDERHYIAMEYLEGGDLKERISKGITIDEALDLLETLAACLDFVHRKGIVHRDIKPENILFRDDGTPIITDFGIAKQTEIDSSLTLDGMALGSPYYLSPEQAGCKALDGRADIYSLGILFYEMITGSKPYLGDSPIDIIVGHMTSPIPSLPPALCNYQCLLDRMIAKEPDERFDSAETLLEYVRALRETGPFGAAAEKLSCFLQRIRPAKQSGDPEDAAHNATGSSEIRLDPRETTAEAHSFRKVSARLFSPGLTPGKIVTVIGLASLLIAASLYNSAFEAPPQTATPVLGSQAVAVPEDNAPVVEVEEDPRLILQNEIADGLDQAAAAIKDYRLTTPPRNNAYYYYRQVLDKDPSNASASQGLKDIGDAYADLAAYALENDEYTKAKTYLRRGLRVQPGNKRLLALNERSNTIRDFGTRFFGQIKSVFD